MHLILTVSRDLRGFLASLQLVKDLSFCYLSVSKFIKGKVETEREMEAGIISLAVLGTLLALAVSVYIMAVIFQAPECMLIVFWSVVFVMVFILGMCLARQVSK